MTHLQRLKIRSLFKWVSSNFIGNHFFSIGSISIDQNPRFYTTKVETLNQTTSSSSSQAVVKFSRATIKEAQAALLEYLHDTRGLHFIDAEHMSLYSPHFLDEKLLKRVRCVDDIRSSVNRLLRYNPINEYEPFFESLGLNHVEYAALLPHNLIFLSDDDMLLENYHVLCNYGIARDKIGRVYKHASEVFKYELGVLPLKLKVYEKLGLTQDFVAKVVVCSPKILIGDVNVEFVNVFDLLKSLRFEFSWVSQHLLDDKLYDWSMILRALRSLMKIGIHEDQLSRLISQHPGLIFECSGCVTISLISFLLKFGSTLATLHSMFMEFPQVQVAKFVINIRNCLMFFKEIEMEADEISKIVSSQPLLLGSSTLKKTNTILHSLNTGKMRICEHILKNPKEINNWVRGLKIEPLPNALDLERQKKVKFLLDLGFEKDSENFKKACKVFRGKGGDLQERFNYIVELGFDRKDVIKMVKVSPQSLNQTKDMIKRKIDILVNDLGYPLSTLLTFSSYLDYRPQRVKLRVSMYNWLKDRGRVQPNLSLTSIVSCTEIIFVKRYVNLHPEGPEVWQNLKEQIIGELYGNFSPNFLFTQFVVSDEPTCYVYKPIAFADWSNMNFTSAYVATSLIAQRPELVFAGLLITALYVEQMMKYWKCS
ncbi:hypothetical protein ACFE04_000761 [Oxalis oulophora]